MERVAVDVPADYLGVVTQLLALRKGSMIEMVNHGTGWVRLDYRVPPEPRGLSHRVPDRHPWHGVIHHVFDGWSPGTASSVPGATGRWWPTGAGQPPPTHS